MADGGLPFYVLGPRIRMLIGGSNRKGSRGKAGVGDPCRSHVHPPTIIEEIGECWWQQTAQYWPDLTAKVKETKTY
jgi:hypothetical protein